MAMVWTKVESVVSYIMFAFAWVRGVMARSKCLDGVGAMRGVDAMRGVGGIVLVLVVEVVGVCSSVLCSRAAIGVLFILIFGNKTL